jgi:hypothetical protein
VFDLRQFLIGYAPKFRGFAVYLLLYLFEGLLLPFGGQFMSTMGESGEFLV